MLPDRPEIRKKIVRLQEYLRKNQADKQFYLSFLSTLHARGLEQKVFAKDFVYQPVSQLHPKY